MPRPWSSPAPTAEVEANALSNASTTLLRWKGTIDGRPLESLEPLIDDANGLLIERTIALRPYPALQIFREKMRADLGDSLGPGM